MKRLKRGVAHALGRARQAFERPRLILSLASSRRALAALRTRHLPASARDLLTLAWPIATAMLSETLLGLVDTKLVGGLGPLALGGVGVATMLMFLHYSVVFGLMRGVKVRTAHAAGRGEPQRGLRYARAGVVLGGVIGLAVFGLGRDVGPFLRAIGIDPQLRPYARDFFAAVTFGAPATCMMAALVNHRQAISDARTPMIVGITGNVVNGALSYALVYGHWSFPALGVRGAGYGTAVTEWVEVAVLLAVLRRDERRRGPEATPLPLREAAREVLGIGLPTGLHFGAELLAMSTFTAILGSIEVTEMAANQIGMAIVRTSFLPGVAVAEASCVLVGRALGRGSLDEARRVNRAALATAVTFMAACGLLFAIAGGALVSAFTSDPEVARVARRLLWVASVFQVLDACNIVLRGSLRGAKDVHAVAAIGVAVAWVCIPSAAFFLGKLAGLGAVGGWLGFVAETTLGSALLWARWQRGGWRQAYLPKASDGAPAALATARAAFG